MKNKEIEEILNYMKQYVENIYEHDSEPMLNWKDLQIVLSYIEQLENNRDKAIEYINKNIAIYHKQLPLIAIDYEEVINILKGDSDYE